jgi:glyoxylase-like metal-dependent hydrolase (beta-lactamase superfamily II)
MKIMIVGKFKIDVLDTGQFGLDGGSMFGVVPKTMWSKSYHPGDDLNRIPLAARPLLIQYDEKKILIDAGNGTKWNEKLAAIYNIDLEKSNMSNALSPFELKPEEITHVVFSHLHFDHCGGATKMENDNLVPTFSNAKHYVQKEHLNWALKPSEKDRASFIRDNFIPILKNGMMETIDGEGEIFPGIRAIPVFGHTHSMQMIKISDGGETILYCADLSPTSAHIHIPVGLSFDNHPIITLQEKKQFIPLAYEEGWTIVYEHDVFKQASKINKNDKGFFAEEEILITPKV